MNNGYNNNNNIMCSHFAHTHRGNIKHDTDFACLSYYYVNDKHYIYIVPGSQYQKRTQKWKGDTEGGMFNIKLL